MGRKAKEGIELSAYAITTIKKAIIDKGMNGAEFSEMLGRDDSYISHVFSGQQTLTPRMLELICRVLEINKEALNEPLKSEPKEAAFDIDKFVEALKNKGVTLMPEQQSDPRYVDANQSVLRRLDKIHARVESLDEQMKQIKNGIETQNRYIAQLLDKFGTDEERLATERAITFLKDKMKNGHANESDVYREADEQGISRLALGDARKELGIVTTFRGYGKNTHSVLIYEKGDK